MSYLKIKEAAETAHLIDSWSLNLLAYKHKSRPSEYTSYPARFITADLMQDTILQMVDNFFGIVEKYGRRVEDYSGMNPKEMVDKISILNPLIISQWENLILSLEFSNDTLDLGEIKANAFVFSGIYSKNDEEKNLYLISRKNPIYIYKKGKNKFLASVHNTIREIKEPLLQFGRTVDAIVFENVLYTINNNFESIFNMEYSHRIRCKSVLEKIKEENIVESFEDYEKFALSGHQPRKFITFEPTILDNIKTEQSLKIMKDELYIPYDEKNGKFLLHEFKHAEVFTKALCGKTKRNMFIEGICEVADSTPLKFS